MRAAILEVMSIPEDEVDSSALSKPPLKVYSDRQLLDFLEALHLRKDYILAHRTVGEFPVQTKVQVGSGHYTFHLGSSLREVLTEMLRLEEASLNGL